mmetsp:Transcript_22834/g.73063  ORF Transcript_22834/g.73063 Transcript_22834/m.73063 type:complete len:262 (+) Transcript_22834:167-952(+)
MRYATAQGWDERPRPLGLLRLRPARAARIGAPPRAADRPLRACRRTRGVRACRVARLVRARAHAARRGRQGRRSRRGGGRGGAALRAGAEGGGVDTENKVLQSAVRFAVEVAAQPQDVSVVELHSRGVALPLRAQGHLVDEVEQVRRPGYEEEPPPVFADYLGLFPGDQLATRGARVDQRERAYADCAILARGRHALHRVVAAEEEHVGRGGRQQRRGASNLTIEQAHEDPLLLVLSFLVVAKDLRRASPDALVVAVRPHL